MLRAQDQRTPSTSAIRALANGSSSSSTDEILVSLGPARMLEELKRRKGFKSGKRNEYDHSNAPHAPEIVLNEDQQCHPPSS